MNDFTPPLILAEYLGKSAIIIALGFAILAAVRKFIPASGKHSLWLLVFAACLAIPFLLVIFPRWEILPDLFATPELKSPAIEIGGSPEIYTTTFTPEGGYVVPAKESEFVISWPWILFAVWGAGVLFLMIREIYAGSFLRKVERSSEPASGPIFEKFTELNTARNRGTILMISQLVKSPFTWGLVRPRIVLPESATSWSETDLEMILLHELEHVRRRDSTSVFVSHIFLALNWANPLAWLANQQAVRFREEACDSTVLKAGHASERYAEMLFRQAKSSTNPFLQTCATAVAETGTIENRIKMILNPNSEINAAPNSTKPAFSKFSAVVAIGIAVVIGMAGCEKSADVGKAESVEPDKIESASDEPESPELARMNKKLDSLIIPSIEFVETPLSDAVDFLRMRSVELDSMETDSTKKGINIIVAPGRMKDTSLSLKLTNVPLRQALIYVAELGGGGIKVDEYAVTIGYEKTDPSVAASGNADLRVAATETKLKEIIIPSIEFQDTPFADAMAFLVQRSVELDQSETDPNRKGVNVILLAAQSNNADPFGGGGGAIPADARITLKLSNVPLAAALKYTCELAGLEYEVGPDAVLVVPKGSKPKPNKRDKADNGGDPFGE